MKADIDRLMKEHKLDAMMVVGNAQHNPAMVYFTGGGHINDATLLKKRGQEPVLYFFPMEREEAARTGLKTISFSKYLYTDFMKEAGGNLAEAMVLRMKKILTDQGLTSGRVGIYGESEVGSFYSLFSRLQQLMPKLFFEGYFKDEILLSAMMTKEPGEIERIRQMGKVTTDVVGKTAEFLTSQKTKKGMLVHKDGTLITIGEVKRKINLWLAEHGVENPEGTIFAIGRDAGIPHSTGTASDALRLGQTIVYDIFPCEAGGGYFYDFTRTWCLGYAPDPVLKVYEEVKKVYDTVFSELQMNEPFMNYQKRTCELFESMGHPTILNSPTIENGYCHSLGHGIGLQVHEKPWASMVNPSPTDILAPNSVFTLEPGLYYPENGMGVRIEDSLVAKPDGTFEILADYPKDLVLPLK
jgi:Xaa-Pro aminopeptidase